MKITNAKLLVALASLSLALTACKENYFVEEKYDELLIRSFPVGSVNPNHTWAVFGSTTLQAHVNGDSGKKYRVAVYQEDPLTASYVTLLASSEAVGGQTAVLHFSYLLAQPTVYVACRDENSHQVVMSRKVVNGETIDLSFAGTEDGTAATAQEHSNTYRFCFEDQFPHPGDYDFNDCVITVNPVVSGKNVTVRVVLNAVGTNKQIAAAMRIKGLLPDAVVAGTNTFVDYAASYESMRYVTPVMNDKGETFFYVNPETGLGKDARGNQINDLVVSLFNDAHWAMSKADAGGNNQYMHAYFYNTMDKRLAGDERGRIATPTVITLTMTIDSEEHVQLFNDIMNYDMFLLEKYSNRLWEVHTYPFKFDQVLKEYENYTDKLTPYISNPTKNYPWALLVPGTFLYPNEWQSICGYSNTTGSETKNTKTAYKMFRSWAINPGAVVEEVKQWYLKENIEDIQLVWQ